jgi:V/A-type H+-transporting ATPase subunit G/H
MSLEALKKVTETEREVSEKIALAIADAKRIVAEAENAARQKADEARKNARASAAKAVEDAGRTSESGEKAIRAGTDADCEALRKKAAGKMDAAATLISGRVVNG